MYEIFFFVGALVPTFVVSRILLAVTKTWDGGIRRIVLVHIFSLLIAVVVGGMGMADGGAFAPVAAGVSYFLPQLVWLVVDLFRQKRVVHEPIIDRTKEPSL